MRSTSATRRFNFSSSRSSGSSSTSRVAILVAMDSVPFLVVQAFRPAGEADLTVRTTSSSSLHGAVPSDQRGQQLIEAALHFGVGQRAIVRLKSEPQRKADLAVRNAL